ncbi:MAG: 3-oxoadipate enol-lactonase / 4-carboxymuconolactone decarboxylase [Frankiaceae bacterium]|nr:3-oxoadipate enol-lactonase / 4-carboxymuconolactone decarboxylase [Frankiaceae bacterium]
MTRPLLVLGPSLGTSAETLWGRCAAALEAEFEILAWDLPGHGRNRSPAPAQLRIEDLSRFVLDLVGGRPFSYAGDSVGGAVGLQLLLDAPAQVASAVLLCTGAQIGEPQQWHERATTVRTSGTTVLLESSAERWFGPGFRDRHPDRAEVLLGALAEADDAGYSAVCEALAAFDVRSRLPEVAAPVLAVAGASDIATPPARLREIAEGVQHGRFVELDGVAHLAPAEAPEVVAELVRTHCRPNLANGAGARFFPDRARHLPGPFP